LAVVTDEYGEIEGITTPIDILKAIAGELPELGSRERPEAIARPDGTWLIDGHLPIEELQRRLNRRDMAGRDYHTVAGFVLARLGRIPKAGDKLAWRDLRIEIVDMDGVRSDKILLARADKRGRDDAWGRSVKCKVSGQRRETMCNVGRVRCLVRRSVPPL